MDNRASDRTSLVRHEERLTAAVQRVSAGATRVRKRVITETVTVEVEVQREVLEVEQPTRAASASTGAVPALGDERGETVGADELARRTVDDVRADEVQVITLHRQRPVVTLETVPYEEARVVKRVVTSPYQTSETVRREHVDVLDVDAQGLVSDHFR